MQLKRTFLTVLFISISLGMLISCKEEKRYSLPYTEPLPIPKFSLKYPGTEFIVDYEKYGRFEGIGTAQYKYIITDQKGLMDAVGEGIWPNTTAVRLDPKFKEYSAQGLLKGNAWDFVHGGDPLANFFKWNIASEPKGVAQYYRALILEKAGLIKHAIKAYYAIVVHFPYEKGWTFWHTPWYIGPASLHRIHYLTRRYPDVGVKLVDASIVVKNGQDDNILNDEFIVNPGRLVPAQKDENLPKKVDTTSMRVIKRKGAGVCQLVQYENGAWQLLVNRKPFIIKGVTYGPTKVGQSPDEGTMKSWMFYDYNKNGIIDPSYESWVDWNHNNQQDPGEEPVGDFAIMKAMGVNCIRVYHHPERVNKELLRDLYKRFGIYVVMGDFLGMYTIGSGAAWEKGTDYSDPQQQENMLNSVRQMVEEFKDEEYVLFWLLGNENNYGVANNAKKEPEAYYKFVNRVAQEIKRLDPKRPVAVCNGDLLYLDILAANCPDVDIFGTNAYRGEAGFGALWSDAKRLIPDKAVMITEYGCPAYAKGMTRQQAGLAQAEYYLGSWEDILYNSAFYDWGAGNSIGGFAFEFLDEWWKAYEPYKHNTESRWSGPFPDGWMYEEWLGLLGQGDGKDSPFKREVREVCFLLRDLWTD